jgi:hypothetical protein
MNGLKSQCLPARARAHTNRRARWVEQTGPEQGICAVLVFVWSLLPVQGVGRCLGFFEGFRVERLQGVGCRRLEYSYVTYLNMFT